MLVDVEIQFSPLITRWLCVERRHLGPVSEHLMTCSQIFEQRVLRAEIRRSSKSDVVSSARAWTEARLG